MVTSDYSSIHVFNRGVQGASASAPFLSTIHAKIVRRAAAQWGEDNSDVLVAVRRRLVAGDTTTTANACGTAKAAYAKRECAVAGDVDEGAERDRRPRRTSRVRSHWARGASGTRARRPALRGGRLARVLDLVRAVWSARSRILW